MSNLHVIGPLLKLEKLVQDKMVELINTPVNRSKQRYDFMSLVLDNCKVSKDIQTQFIRVVNSFNGSTPDSVITTILPTIIKNKLDELNNKEINEVSH